MHSLGLKNCTWQKIQNGASFAQQLIQAPVITNINLHISSVQSLHQARAAPLVPWCIPMLLSAMLQQEPPLQCCSAAAARGDTQGREGFSSANLGLSCSMFPYQSRQKEKNSVKTFKQTLCGERVSWRSWCLCGCRGSLAAEQTQRCQSQGG